MDREPEELQFLGFIGIYKEALKIIFSWRKIFTQITLALILPLTFIFLAHIEIYHLIASNILHHEIALDHTQMGTPRYRRLVNLLSSERTTFYLFEAVYFLFLLIFSLLSTSAVVYTIASIYSIGKELNFKKVMSVVPKVWKRLMVTFLCCFTIVILYSFVPVIFYVIWATFVPDNKTIDAVVPELPVAISVLYSMGFVYISIVWHLASVVSVMEDACGIQALLNSKELIEGKMGVAVVIVLKFNLSFGLIQVAFQRLVVYGESFGMGSRIAYGIVCFLLQLMLFLLGLVVQTVIYFVCKSYHHENIDKSSLADHLEVYLGEYVPLKGKDIQLEEYHV